MRHRHADAALRSHSHFCLIVAELDVVGEVIMLNPVYGFFSEKCEPSNVVWVSHNATTPEIAPYIWHMRFF